MNKTSFEKLVNLGLDTGADFSEIFYEETINNNINFSNSVIINSDYKKIKGAGIRLALKDQVYYSSISNPNYEDIEGAIKDLNKNFSEKRTISKISLKSMPIINNDIKLEHNFNNLKLVKEKLHNYDEYARNLDKRVDQVNIILITTDQNVTIANSDEKYVQDKRVYTRIFITVIVKEETHCEQSSYSIGALKGFELLDDEKIKKGLNDTVKTALDKLLAKPCPGGEMPVIIGPGFGGVIIHEACGHAMEATTVADKTSVLSDKLNQKIANEKVTIIDDGTINKSWGSLNYDDEGNNTNKNVLVENGVLKKYLVDVINERTMKNGITGSGRRESYMYAPTSRMNNTFLAKGSDKLEDMIASIKYGLYAKNMGGGSVDPATGDFNFAVNDAYMIRNGKIAEAVKGATLIGNTKDILKNIDMISDDLELAPGMCGSISGYVPVCVGQPTIRVSKILVGGNNIER